MLATITNIDSKRRESSLTLSWAVEQLYKTLDGGPLRKAQVVRLMLAWGNYGYAAGASYLCQIVQCAQSPEYKRYLECGTGVSTILLGVIARHCGGHLTSLEQNQHWAEHMRRVVSNLGLTQWVDVRYCPVVERSGDYDWYCVDVSELSDIDLVICDGPTSQTRGGRIGCLYELNHTLNAGATILLDDTHRKDEQAAIAQWSQTRPISTQTFSGLWSKHSKVTIRS
ncbi:MAG: class I SAM-dependent methyltransferase [Gammaproteobacteria bacterium]|nr:class I SAM-dependent methyltransferase [Gammaproteobacteria bacterium]